MPYEFEESEPEPFSAPPTSHPSRQSLRVASQPISHAEMVEPELALPALPSPSEQVYAITEPELAVLPVVSDLDPTVSTGQRLYGGYDELVDSYVHQLLAGQGSDTPCCNNLSPSSVSYELASGLDSERQTGWYGQSQALTLNPVSQDRVEISRDASGTSVLSTADTDIGWSPGFDVRLGFRTNTTGVEFGWWTMLAESDSAQAIRPTSDLVPAINFNGIGIPFGPAQLHQIETELEAQSIEIRHVVANPHLGDLQCGFWWGVRFFKVREDFRFLSDLSTGATLDDIQYEVSVDNRMVGPYLGGVATWRIAPRLALRFETQAGVYYNYMDQKQVAQNDIGIATFNTGPNAGRPFDFETNDVAAAVLSEVNIGVEYKLKDRLQIVGGYRIVAAAGLARTVSQIPQEMGDINSIEIVSGDSLLLHGFQLGLNFRF